MSAPLTVHNAEIRTATVEIRTLTVSGKQVTQSVFRQLQETPLIDLDGNLNGVPWGRVNYHPDKCAESRFAHWHVVWQDGTELRRSRVNADPGFDVFWPDEAEDLYAGCVLHWLRTGEVRYWKGGLFDLFTGKLTDHAGNPITERYQQKSYLDARDELKFTAEGIRVGVCIRDAIRAATLAELDARSARASLSQAEAGRQRLRATTSALDTCGKNWGSGACCQAHIAQDLERAQEKAERCADEVAAAKTGLAAALAALAAELPTEDIDSLRELYANALTAEAARRQRQQEVRKAIADLPQLFIAV